MRLASSAVGSFASKVVLPVLACAVVVSFAAAGLLLWSSQEADSIARERQERLVRLVISQMQTTIAHDQESVTVWDDAVEALRNGAEEEWIDNNLGSWMGEYFGHDSAYILDPANRLIHAFDSDTGKGDFAAIAGPVTPLVDAMRQKMLAGDEEGVGGRILSPGVSDLMVIDGHPSMVSVKPVVSDTGNIEQIPGSEYLHIAVRHLDGDLASGLERDYLLEGLRFSWTNDAAEGESGLPLTAASGDVLGYFIWRPYKPGEAVLTRLTPVLMAILGVVLLIIATLLTVLNQRSRKLSASEARMQYLALHDALTGLPNRALLNERLDAALRRVRRTDEKVAVLYLDLDRFKQVNDTLGHPAGDDLIRAFGIKLGALVREGDTVARIGGDEFIVIASRLHHVREVEDLCERIVESVRQPFEIQGNQVFAGVSVGVAVAPAHGEERTELIRKADIALYHAKNAGRGRYAVFGNIMDSVLQTRRNVERDLRFAMKRHDQIEVHYQPLYCAGDMNVAGVEALLRWKHPTKGWISPTVFVPVAEETGLIEPLGERVLREACGAAAAWPDLMLAVNASTIELRNPNYAPRVAGILRECQFDPERLEIEVTESALSDNSGCCEENIKALREMGVRIALDDFGTGFSSLGRLQQFQVDRIKIDRSFVSGFGRLSGDEAVVQAIVDLAHAKGLKTTAEGVETSEQGDYLKQIGCDQLQGFLFSRPVTRDGVDQLLGVKREEDRPVVSAA